MRIVCEMSVNPKIQSLVKILGIEKKNRKYIGIYCCKKYSYSQRISTYLILKSIYFCILSVVFLQVFDMIMSGLYLFLNFVYGYY